MSLIQIANDAANLPNQANISDPVDLTERVAGAQRKDHALQHHRVKVTTRNTIRGRVSVVRLQVLDLLHLFVTAAVVAPRES